MEAIRRTTAAPKADWVGANGCNSAHAGGRPVARWLAGCAPHTVKVAFPTAVSFADSVADESAACFNGRAERSTPPTRKLD